MIGFRQVCFLALLFLMAQTANADETLSIAEREKLLNQAVSELKQEYLGLDETIGKFADSIRNWYLYPEQRTEPLVLLVPGNPGVGKTSLILKLLQKIKADKDLFYRDMRQGALMRTIKKPRDIYEEENGKMGFAEYLADQYMEKAVKMEAVPQDAPIEEIRTPQFQRPERPVLFIDELQLMNTKDRIGKKVERPQNQGIWEFLGNHGRLRIPNQRRKFLRNLVYGIASFDTNILRSIALPTDIEQSAFHQLVVEKTDQILEHMRTLPDEQVVDLSHSLVIFGANLDDLLEGAKSFDNETYTPDELRKKHQEITLSTLRQQLGKLFQPAEVSRLGFRFIVFPSPSTKHFEELIKRKIKEISHEAGHPKLKLSVSQEVLNRIYQEGVFAGQGVRPLDSTITLFITQPLSEMRERVQRKLDQGKKIEINVETSSDGRKTLWNVVGSKEIYQYEVPQDSLNASLPREDDAGYRAAVHESAKAVVSMQLRDLVPHRMRANTSQTGYLGLTVFTPREDMSLSENDFLMHTMAVEMAGKVGEEKVFGEVGLTYETAQELAQATAIARKLVEGLGRGESKSLTSAPLSPLQPNHILQDPERLNRDVSAYLEQARKLALDALEAQPKLWSQLAKELKEKVVLDQKQIEAIRRKHWVGPVPSSRNCSTLFSKWLKSDEKHK